MYILDSWSTEKEGNYFVCIEYDLAGQGKATLTTDRTKAHKYGSLRSAKSRANDLWNRKLGTFTPKPF